MFGQYGNLLQELNREDPRCYKSFLHVDADLGVGGTRWGNNQEHNQLRVLVNNSGQNQMQTINSMI